MNVDWTNARVLLMDTCGTTSSLALAEGADVVETAVLPGRMASAQLLGAVRAMLERAGWTAGDLQAVGVVSGPGSFTGVRVGLSAAKGLCEALSLPLAAVSRLGVLEHVEGRPQSVAVLDAGRGEVYVRESGREFLMAAGNLRERFGGRTLLLAEESLQPGLEGLAVRLVEIEARHAVPLVQRRLAEGGSDVALTDANYVRGEAQIYAKKTA